MVDYVLTEGGNTKFSAQGIREVKTANTTRVGSEKPMAFGKKVRYVKIGGTGIARGLVCQGPAVVANQTGINVAATASIGAKEVDLVDGGTSVAKNAYKDGYLIIATGAGSGYSYMVEGHDAWAASATAARVILKDGLEVALTTASIASLIPNPDNGVLVAVAGSTPTATYRGVTLMSAEASGFCYLGTKGPWMALAGTLAISIGDELSQGSAAGTVAKGAVNYIGRAMSSAAAGSLTTYVLVDFDID